MANYIVTNSRFRPFSYEEMLAPVMLADTAHKELESQYANLEVEADEVDRMADEQRDPESWALYKDFSNNLAKEAEALSAQGLTPNSRRALNTLRSRYVRDVDPIKQAYNRRQQLVEERRQDLLKDPTLLYDINPADISLDTLRKNPTLTPQSYSGALLTSQAASIGKELADELRSDPKTFEDILGKQYYQQVLKYGFSSDDIMRALTGDPTAPRVLIDVINRVYQSSGIPQWITNQNTRDRAREYIGQGLYSTIGDTKIKELQNRGYDFYMRNWLAEEEWKRNNRDNTVSEETIPINSRTVELGQRKGSSVFDFKERDKATGVDSKGKVIVGNGGKEGAEDDNVWLRANNQVITPWGTPAFAYRYESKEDKESRAAKIDKIQEDYAYLNPDPVKAYNQGLEIKKQQSIEPLSYVTLPSDFSDSRKKAAIEKTVEDLTLKNIEVPVYEVKGNSKVKEQSSITGEDLNKLYEDNHIRDLGYIPGEGLALRTDDSRFIILNSSKNKMLGDLSDIHRESYNFLTNFTTEYTPEPVDVKDMGKSFNPIIEGNDDILGTAVRESDGSVTKIVIVNYIDQNGEPQRIVSKSNSRDEIENKGEYRKKELIKLGDALTLSYIYTLTPQGKSSTSGKGEQKINPRK